MTTTRPAALTGNTAASTNVQVAKVKYAPGTPPWARIAAHAVPFVVLPSSVWRLLMTAGLAGVGHPQSPNYRSQPSDYLYVLLLSVVGEGFALLTLGLVKPWGEVVPRWIPLLGGRRVPIKAAVIPATAGALLLLLIAAYFFLDPIFFHVHFTPSTGDRGTPTSHLEVHGWSRTLFAACYLPLLAWPGLVGAVTCAYHRRRTAEGELT
ncbi:hypothetical protein OG455_07305 [Kitasatospora sp. NBC_01287]|uniref:hypothetical protein n=1 Tax=Kitasatospora sp. NBC_01287 TaxID=2903573 RepID=UPI0022548541|nr:hypothetical protein [Kitasatospora sp. NBC_01287]MCX4745331.1 hypothetical protein [Kitasatospora sp. NBC_01287]